MVDIAAAKVTAQVLSRRYAGNADYGGTSSVGREMEVELLLTIDPGTTDAYPTGGIPLTTIFTEANGQEIDTGLDVAQQITPIGQPQMRISTGVTVLAPAIFHNGGQTAASQTL